jgi:hypothetical protein
MKMITLSPVPNALDLPMWLTCVLLLVKIEQGASPRLWIWLGSHGRSSADA